MELHNFGACHIGDRRIRVEYSGIDAITHLMVSITYTGEDGGVYLDLTHHNFKPTIIENTSCLIFCILLQSLEDSFRSRRCHGKVLSLWPEASFP